MEQKQSKVKDGNFFVVQSFMVKELKLKGLELLCFAIIYGFSQAEGQSFNAPMQYLCDWTCSSRQAVTTALAKLVEKGLLLKREKFINGVKFVGYSAIYRNAVVMACLDEHVQSHRYCIGALNYCPSAWLKP